MIAVTSPVIKVNATKDELFNFFSNPSQTAKIIEHTSVRHLQVTEDGFVATVITLLLVDAVPSVARTL